MGLFPFRGPSRSGRKLLLVILAVSLLTVPCVGKAQEALDLRPGLWLSMTDPADRAAKAAFMAEALLASHILSPLQRKTYSDIARRVASDVPLSVKICRSAAMTRGDRARFGRTYQGHGNCVVSMGAGTPRVMEAQVVCAAGWPFEWPFKGTSRTEALDRETAEVTETTSFTIDGQVKTTSSTARQTFLAEDCGDVEPQD